MITCNDKVSLMLRCEQCSCLGVAKCAQSLDFKGRLSIGVAYMLISISIKPSIWFKGISFRRWQWLHFGSHRKWKRLWYLKFSILRSRPIFHPLCTRFAKWSAKCSTCFSFNWTQSLWLHELSFAPSCGTNLLISTFCTNSHKIKMWACDSTQRHHIQGSGSFIRFWMRWF